MKKPFLEFHVNQQKLYKPSRSTLIIETAGNE